MDIGFIGLGQMGRPMAARLMEAGHRLMVWNRTAGAAEALVEAGAERARAPAHVLAAPVVITMLADDAAVESVWIEQGLVPAMPAGGLHINMATVSVALASRLAQAHAKHGSGYVAAPVFGRPAVAALGQLDVIAAGAADALARAEPLFKCLGKQLFVVGEVPALANAVKIARNFLLACAIESLGEAFALTGAHGVPRERFLEIITSTSLGSPAYRSYGKLMVERAYEPAQFTMQLGLKDIELALATARDAGLDLPSARLIRGHVLQCIEAGQGGRDWAAIAEALSRPAAG
jgi:3-hydroxyisobutyrate dehydrogenase-like beta-hydroxyacid dehydrogenase